MECGFHFVLHLAPYEGLDASTMRRRKNHGSDGFQNRFPDWHSQSKRLPETTVRTGLSCLFAAKPYFSWRKRHKKKDPTTMNRVIYSAFGRTDLSDFLFFYPC